jgi:lysyl-tRNA synthetase class 2
MRSIARTYPEDTFFFLIYPEAPWERERRRGSTADGRPYVISSVEDLACSLLQGRAGRYTRVHSNLKDFPLQFEPHDQFEQRQKKLQQIRALGQDAYPREFRWTDTAAALVEKYWQVPGTELEAEKREVRVAGRIVSIRLMGKAGFAHLQGAGKRIQIYVKKDVVGEQGFQLFHLLDLGDFIGVRGHLFRTKTNELSIWVEELFFLSKALLPLPEKWHGLTDVELRYRQRYLDLIANEKSREVFATRARIIQELRRFFDGRGYIEVETPMMHPIPGGAAARPFITHHNTLDVDLYLRIAPELYLKRLTVGGFDRVYEINRNFRNEGISTQHNPEFTMLEFYEAYSNYQDLMDMNEQLFTLLAKNITGSTTVKYGETELDFSKMQRLSMREAIVKYWPAEAEGAPSLKELAAPGGAQSATNRYNVWAKRTGAPYAAAKGKLSHGEWTGLLFETMAEDKLVQPTILYDFPTDISPLSKQKPEDPSLTERFEIYIAGMEVANGFSELNDPAEQERRFLAQIAQGGEEMPKQLDVDYIRALCHGMPPTAGEGIGIDRLTMLLTDSQSIRDVILFPQLRPEGGGEASSASEAPGA